MASMHRKFVALTSIVSDTRGSGQPIETSHPFWGLPTMPVTDDMIFEFGLTTARLAAAALWIGCQRRLPPHRLRAIRVGVGPESSRSLLVRPGACLRNATEPFRMVPAMSELIEIYTNGGVLGLRTGFSQTAVGDRVVRHAAAGDRGSAGCTSRAATNPNNHHRRSLAAKSPA